MAKVKLWEVSDAFWEKVFPLIPASERDPSKVYRCNPGGGRWNTEAIMYVLRTGCKWKALPKERFGISSAIHTHFMR